MIKRLEYTGCPPKKSGHGGIFSTLTSLDKASSAEENDTKIITFGWVILNLYAQFLKYSHFKIRLIFATDERRIVSGKAFHIKVFWGSPLIRGNKIIESKLRNQI